MSDERMHILLATDDSIASRAAEAWTTNLRWAQPPQVRVVTVAASTMATTPWIDGAHLEHLLPTIAEADKSEQERAREVADAVTRRLRAAGLDALAVARQGVAASEILIESVGAGADLVVLGPRGRSEFTTALLGGVTQQVLAHSRVPVLVARSTGVPPGRLPQTIILPVTGTLEVHGAIDWLTRAGWLLGSKVAIIGLLGGSPGLSVEQSDIEEKIHDGLRSAAEETLRDLADLADTGASTVAVELRFGSPLQLALAAADEHQADLIVVGRQPHRPGDQPFADKVARYASTSVLLVPTPGSDEVGPNVSG